jgi:hypothetical protein
MPSCFGSERLCDFQRSTYLATALAEMSRLVCVVRCVGSLDGLRNDSDLL